MTGRRTLILDAEAKRDSITGVPKEMRQQRVKTLKRLFDLFEGNDAVTEVRRLKVEDQGF